MIENSVIERPFLHLFGDAIKLLMLAERCGEGSDDEGLFSRSSILHSVLALESAANCCLREHSYPRRLLEKIDGFTTLDKFEFLLTTIGPGKTLDRGCKTTQAIDELISIRNRYVHPKGKCGPLMPEAIADSVIAIQGGSHPITNLSDRSICWNASDARCAVAAVIDFLNAFFLDWCQLGPGKVERLLVSSVSFDTQLLGEGERQGFGIMCDLRVPELLRATELSARFIDFNRWCRERSVE